MRESLRALAEQSSVARGAARCLWFCRAVASRFYRDQCLQHASALAYTTLLSLVPLLAVMFAVLKGFGVQRRLEPLLLSRLGLTPETTEQARFATSWTEGRESGA